MFGTMSIVIAKNIVMKERDSVIIPIEDVPEKPKRKTVSFSNKDIIYNIPNREDIYGDMCLGKVEFQIDYYNKYQDYVPRDNSKKIQRSKKRYNGLVW
jgi:hypothetical protein